MFLIFHKTWFFSEVYSKKNNIKSSFNVFPKVKMSFVGYFVYKKTLVSLSGDY